MPLRSVSNALVGLLLKKAGLPVQGGCLTMEAAADSIAEALESSGAAGTGEDL